MSYKNTVKAFATNFTLVWKQLLYMLLCICVCAVCAYFVSLPVVELFKDNGVGEEISSIFKTIYTTPSEIVLKVSDVFKHMGSLIVENLGKIYPSLIGLFFFAFLFPFIFLQMSMFNLTSILNQKLSMNMNAKYLQNGIKNFKSSFLYSISNLLFSLPFYAIYIVSAVIYFRLANTTFSAIFGLVILSAFLLVIRSLKLSLFTCYSGYMAETNSNAMVAFGKGTSIALKNIGKIFSNSLIVNLTLIFIESFIGVFTFLAGLIIVIPASYVFIAIFYNVVYFNSKGSRYYLGQNLIFNPTMYKVDKNQSEKQISDENLNNIIKQTEKEEVKPDKPNQKRKVKSTKKAKQAKQTKTQKTKATKKEETKSNEIEEISEQSEDNNANNKSDE